jgi:hypothetical protein
MTASDVLHNADAYRRAHPHYGRPAEPATPDPVAAVFERQQRITAILSGQPVPPQPRVLTAGEPAVLDGADPDADLEYAAERADFDNGEG